MCLHYSMGRHYVMTIIYRLQLWNSLSDWRLRQFNTLLNRKNDFLFNIGDDFVIDFDSSKMSQNSSNDVIQVGPIWKHAYKEGFNTIYYIQFILYCIESFFICMLANCTDLNYIISCILWHFWTVKINFKIIINMLYIINM